MKNRFGLIIATLLFLVSCNNTKVNKNISDILSSYNEEETLSFENYLSYSLNAPVIKEDETYIFPYEGKRAELLNGNLTFVEEENEDILSFKNIEELKKTDLQVGKVVKTEEFYPGTKVGGARYKIVSAGKNLNQKLDNGLYAEPLPFYNSLSVESLGIYGDGKNDDSTLINNIFLNIAEYDVQTLIFSSKEYLCCSNINIGEVNDLKILGNDSTIIVDDSYNDERYREFFFNISNSDNILFSDLSIKYTFSRSMNGIKTQLGIFASSNLEFVNCEYTIPDTVLASLSKDREFTNFDCYRKWENIIVNNCKFENVCDAEAGGSMWIRDFSNEGSKNIKVLNSYFHKSAHDEMIAVFMGTIENVLISGNKFKVEDNGNSSSVMNFTLGSYASSILADNIIFQNNEIDCCSTGGLIWVRNATNVKIRNNNIKAHISSKSKESFRLFEASPNGDYLSKISSIENNIIEIDSYALNFSSQVHIFKNVENVKNNTITTKMRITDMFLNCEEVTNNICNIEGDSEFVFYNILKKCDNNTININTKLGSLFRYYGCTFINDVEILNNNINYKYNENEEDISYIIMLNDMRMNNFTIRFNNNSIITKNIGNKSRLLFVASQDENQIFYFQNNSVGNYKTPNNDYLKNVEVIR